MYKSNPIGKKFFYMLRMLSLSGFLMVCNATSPVLAGTFEGNQLFVSPTGNDGVSRAQNTIATPWKTISKAMLTAEAGDVVNFRAGTYTVTSDIITHDAANDGTVDKRIVYTNYKDEEVTFSGGRIRIDRKYWTISGINGTTGSILFWVGKDTDGDNIIIENGTFKLTQEGGASNYAPITLQTAGSYNAIIRNNTFIGPGAGLNENTAGLFVWRSRGLKVYGNEFSGFPSALFYKHPNNAADTGIEFYGNYFHDNAQGMKLASLYANVHDNLFVNDEIRVGQAGGTGDAGPTNHGGDYNNIHHNTLYNSKISLIATNEGDGWGATNNTVKDNIFHYGSLRIAPYDVTPHNTTTDYNLYPATERIVNNRINYTLSFWKAFYGQDARSIEGNATFVGGSNPSSISGYLLSNSSLGYKQASDGKDLGANISLLLNLGLDGVARPKPPLVSAP